MKEKLLSCCGIICSECLAYEKNMKEESDFENLKDTWNKLFGFEVNRENTPCKGCSADSDIMKGYYNNCKIHSCVKEKGLANCKGCENVPCEALSRNINEINASIEKMKKTMSKEEIDKYFSLFRSDINLGL